MHNRHEPDLPTSLRNISNEERTDAVSIVPTKRPATNKLQNSSKPKKLKQISLSKIFLKHPNLLCLFFQLNYTLGSKIWIIIFKYFRYISD